MLWFVFAIPGSLILLYIIAIALFSSVQKRLIYYPNYPTREIQESPDARGLSYDEVHLIASDGVKLHGWFIPAENAQATVLFCHGNAGNISHRMESIQIFNRLELNVLIFDYRGYGSSEGKVSEKGTYRDVEAAWQYLVEERGTSPSDIIIFGRSLGGAIAAWAARGKDAKALIIESAFTSIPDIGAQLYPFLPVRLLARYKYSTIDFLKDVHCPVLVIHSVDDEMIPVEHGRRLFAAAGGQKEMMEIRGAHNETILESGHTYENGLRQFISQY